MFSLSFTCKLDWVSYILAITMIASKKIGALLHSMKFLSVEIVLCLCNSTVRPCMEYCCHVWTSAAQWYFDLLD